MKQNFPFDAKTWKILLEEIFQIANSFKSKRKLMCPKKVPEDGVL